MRGTQKALAGVRSRVRGRVAGRAEPARRHRARRRARALRALEQLVADARPQARSSIATTLGAVVGTHAGPGTVGFFWFDDPGVTVQVLDSVTVAMMTRINGIRRRGPPDEWPRPRGFARPELLERSARGRCRASAPRSKKKLARARPCRRSATCSSHRPRRYERAGRRGADRQPGAGRGGGDRRVSGAVASRRRRGRRQMLTARDDRGCRRLDLRDLVQPALARGAAAARDACAAARAARAATASTSSPTTSASRARRPTSRRSTRRASRYRRRGCVSSSARRLPTRAGRARSAARRARGAEPPRRASRALGVAPADARARKRSRARRRLALEELLTLQLAALRSRERRSGDRPALGATGRARRPLPRRCCHSR